MTPLTHIMLIGWPVIAVALFVVLPPRRAVLASLIGAYLFLPMTGYDLPGLTSYTKTTAATLGTLLGVLIFDAGRLFSFRPSLFDLPIVLWCLSPSISSFTNDLGLNDAGSGFVRHLFAWAVPYYLGRVYFSDFEGLREVAIGLFISGLVYAPLCLYEIRMSPQLHTMFYGWHQHSFGQTVRFDGWRPTVFMQHGLAVGFWMSIATLAGFWLWFSGSLRTLFGIPAGLLFIGLAVTTVLCKSFGAITLMAGGLCVLLACRQLGRGFPILLLTLSPIAYITVRAPSLYDGSHLLTFAEQMGSKDRAGSLRYRFEAEDILGAHAWKRPVFGWGTWGRNRPANFDEESESVATDGFWIIVFGTKGLFGLVVFYTMMLLPGLVAWKMLPPVAWYSPRTAGVAVCTAALAVFALDSLLNAMISPVYVLLSGSVFGACTSPEFKTLKQARHSKSPRSSKAAKRGGQVTVKRTTLVRYHD